jgi:colanic acid/amylovoran biosynthesis protein
VLLRDERSRRHLIDIGADSGNIQIVADAAFALSSPPRKAPSERLKVAVSVRDWPHAEGDPSVVNHRYREAVAAAVETLVRSHDAYVTFLSTCQGVPEYWVDDSRVADDIVERLPVDVREHVEVDHEFHTPSALVERLTDVDLVVGTRMHMLILALVAGAAVFPVAYEFKTRELSERLGLGDWVQDFEAVDRETLPLAVDRFVLALPEVRARLGSRVAAERASAADTGRLLAQAAADTTCS